MEENKVYTVVRPPIPSKWKSRKYGTRHVIDRTLGGEIVYVQGRMPSEPWRHWWPSCTLKVWGEYAKTARQVA